MWTDFAACRGLDPELFFPVTETGPGAAQVAAAKAVCGGCPVQTECLRTALATSAVGVWGGTTETERRGMRREAVSAGAASEDHPRAPRPSTISPSRRARMSLFRHPEVVQLARNFVRDPKGIAIAASRVLRTETGFRLLQLADWVSPCAHGGAAVDPFAAVMGRTVPIARIQIVTHEALPGAMLAQSFGEHMAGITRDLVDLHEMFGGWPTATDPHAGKEV